MKKLYVLFLIFASSPLFAIVPDFTNSCGNSAYYRIYASFTPNPYTCNSGQFLPANAIACASCPNGYTCSGGTYTFDADNSQGLVRTSTYMVGNESNVCAANYGHSITAVFTPNSYTCAAGQFLPADAIACVSCPAGYTCAGGTYTFNATQSQGLVRVAQYYTVAATNACASNFPHKLNAVFTPNNISLTWKNENGTTITTNTCTYGQPISLPANPTKTGYVFTGWSVVNN